MSSEPTAKCFRARTPTRLRWTGYEPPSPTAWNVGKPGSTAATAANEPWWNEIFFAPVFDNSGKLVQYIGVQNDVSARILAESELAT